MLLTLKKQLETLEKMERDLFQIQMDIEDKACTKWNKAYDARKSVAEVKHLVLIELGIRKA